MARKLTKNRYVAAFLVTVVVFVLGFILGSATSERKILELEQLSRQQDADFSSLQFQFSYLENVPPEQSCVVLSRTLESNLKTLGPSLKKIEGYEASGDTKNLDYILLKRKYTVANLRYWLLAEKSKLMCGTDEVSILYFYGKGCSQCGDESYILEQLKQRLGDSLLIFPIDASIDEPVTDILRAQYKIYGFPSLVIDGKTYPNYMSMPEILTEICPKYYGDYEFCGGYK
ncbi:MAG: hypothetical protein HYT71_04075 [Candidatus Aenigmarchaeota archaeon]|nr:hypothetical protein [Candidatus Aenigmarchaeota archaeon]